MSVDEIDIFPTKSLRKKGSVVAQEILKNCNYIEKYNDNEYTLDKGKFCTNSCNLDEKTKECFEKFQKKQKDFYMSKNNGSL